MKMDWIERMFGISPDGGTGATEFLILFAIVIVPLMLWQLTRARGARERSRRR
jgi:hypothetical protein